jgi:hypothetical protein
MTRGMTEQPRPGRGAMPEDAAAHAPMTGIQAARLQALAMAAYEPEAYSRNLSQAEAARRIAVLAAKLPLLDGPPHTL